MAYQRLKRHGRIEEVKVEKQCRSIQQGRVSQLLLFGAALLFAGFFFSLQGLSSTGQMCRTIQGCPFLQTLLQEGFLRCTLGSEFFVIRKELWIHFHRPPSLFGQIEVRFFKICLHHDPHPIAGPLLILGKPPAREDR